MVSHDHISSAHICSYCHKVKISLFSPHARTLFTELKWHQFAIRICYRVDSKIPSIRREPCWVVFTLLMLTASCLTLKIKRFRYCRNFRVNPIADSDGTYWVAARCVTEAFSTTCAVHIEDCECRLLSGCHGTVAENWQLNPEVVSWVGLLATAGLFTLAS